ncbi:hypothetical protein [Halobacillus sp. Marseille-Q1614]|uniref:hypothetical protein n=1 Tax=Halobacillus sp. Marseille-Q1614 TaxID=2709134 RepID=UPI0020C22DBD|nr:hypothetical protein [Halobacillus sp. Marseille-Q1614]
MNDCEWILSPCQGTVEEILISEESSIGEWDVLFKICSDYGEIEIVSVDISGSVQSLEVNIGEEVFSGMVLAYIKEDLVAGGSH